MIMRGKCPMRKLRFAVLGVGMALTVSACDPAIGKDEPTPGARALFDPDTSTLPLPNDVLRNSETGMLALPIPEGESELTRLILANLNRLNGWMASMAITVPFDSKLDPSTLTTDTVQLYDVTGVAAQLVDSYYVMFNVAKEPATEPPYQLTVRLKPAAKGQLPRNFELGHMYALVVNDNIRGEDGLPVIGSAAMELLKSTQPLADENGRSLTIVDDASAVQLEGVRRAAYGPALDAVVAAGGVPRSRMVAVTAFTVQPNGWPVFDPVGLPPVLPAPNDISKPADAPLDAKPEVLITVPYDPATAAEAVKLYARGTGALTPVPFTLETSTQDNGKGLYPLRIVPSALQRSTTYQVVMTRALKSTDGYATAPGSLYALVAAGTPILDASGKPASPFVDTTLDVLLLLDDTDPANATEQRWNTATTLLTGSLKTLESQRLKYAPYIEDAVAAGTPRDEITVLWTFTTAAQ
jgi:hypothetical protein